MAWFYIVDRERLSWQRCVVYPVYREGVSRALNDLFGQMFILVAVLPCLQLFQNKTKIFFETMIILLGYV